MNSPDDITNEERTRMRQEEDNVRGAARMRYNAECGLGIHRFDEVCIACEYPRHLCDCRTFEADEKEPDGEDDGEVFRGGEADSYEREQMAEWQGLK